MLGRFFIIVGWANFVILTLVVLFAIVTWAIPPPMLLVQTALNVPFGFGCLFFGRWIRAQNLT